MKYVLFLCISFLTLNLAAQENPKAFVDEALNIMKETSVNRAKLNWQALNREAMDSLAGKKTVREARAVVKHLLGKLGDSHSNFVPEEAVRAYRKTYAEQGMTFPMAKDSLIGGIAYITVPAIGNLNSADWELYVRSFYQKVKAMEAKKPKAWAIDVRENDGGMFVPMFRAIEPFLNAGKVLGSKDASGEVNYYTIQKDAVFFGRRNIGSVAVPVIKLKKPKLPLYILVSKKTASSGEFITASFVGQKNASIVGVNTQGLTSDNSDFKLSDGSIMIITTGTLIDRQGFEYSEIGKGIAPKIKTNGKDLSAYIDAIQATLK